MDVIIVAQPNTIDQLSHCLEELGHAVKGTFKSVGKAVAGVKDDEIADILFVQHELTDGSGFDFLDEAKRHIPVVYMAKDETPIRQVFRYHVVDFLNLPIEKLAVQAALKKYRTYFKDSSEMTYLKDLQSLMTFIARKEQDYKQRFLVKVGNVIKSIGVEEIAYFFTEDRVSQLVTHEGMKYPIDNKMDELEEQLNPQQFFRANRQYVVGIDAIVEIHPYFKGRVKINLQPKQSGDVVISSEKTPRFKEWLDI